MAIEDMLSPKNSKLIRSGAQRQAEFAARKKTDGYKRLTVWIKQTDYEAGSEAAKLGSGRTNWSSGCPIGRDRLSWIVGYCAELDKCETSRAAFLTQKAVGMKL